MSYASLCSQSNTLCSGFSQNLKERVLLFSHWYLCKTRYNNGTLTWYAPCSLLVSIKRSKKNYIEAESGWTILGAKKTNNQKTILHQSQVLKSILNQFCFFRFQLHPSTSTYHFLVKVPIGTSPPELLDLSTKDKKSDYFVRQEGGNLYQGSRGTMEQKFCQVRY